VDLPALDRASEFPIYRQLHQALATQITSTKIPAGSKLPSVRELARTLSVSPITVVQAYDALIADGLAHASLGRGTFVGGPVFGLSPEGTRADPSESPQLAPGPNTEASQPQVSVHLRAPRISAMQSLLKPARKAEVISLAAGTPDPALFPTKTVGRLWSRMIATEDPSFLQYGTPQGDHHLRSWIAGRCRSMGINADPGQILVTSGSQQAIDLVARTFLGPGDHVLVESPTFVTALDIFEERGARLAGIPMDNSGAQPDAAASLVDRYRPRLLYTIPTAHNPTGISLADDRRRSLVALARSRNLLILEDDICSEFTYEGGPPKAIKTYDTSGHVIFVMSFSKTVIPGLRVGCVVADGPILGRLIEAKSLSDRFTSPLIQRTLWRYLTSHHYERDLEAARDTYRRRRDSILRVLADVMPQGVTWTRPAAGFNLWIRLPDGISATEAFEEGLREGVSCIPGDLCLAHDPPPSGLRVSFADNHEDVTAEGIKRLARAITRLLSSGRRARPESEFVTTI
jgi:DNA-binding transcriptional MocR family regulator